MSREARRERRAERDRAERQAAIDRGEIPPSLPRLAAPPPPPPPPGPLRVQIVEAGDFDVLGRYNAERSRGIVHTPEWDARMAELQREFNERQP